MNVFIYAIIACSSILSSTLFIYTNPLDLSVFVRDDHAFELIKKLLISITLPNL